MLLRNSISTILKPPLFKSRLKVSLKGSQL
uniref:Uncharacterized protein n=1 Tax=Medicago truncatula TaxID=3880 RepID=I3S667_MEDTR|nr:unknown [Medicago truncatula]